MCKCLSLLLINYWNFSFSRSLDLYPNQKHTCRLWKQIACIMLILNVFVHPFSCEKNLIKTEAYMCVYTCENWSHFIRKMAVCEPSPIIAVIWKVFQFHKPIYRCQLAGLKVLLLLFLIGYSYIFMFSFTSLCTGAFLPLKFPRCQWWHLCHLFLMLYAFWLKYGN